EDAARRLDPLVVDRAADGRYVDADLVGDLLHFERLDVIGAVVEKLRLVVDDRLRHAGERAPALLDGLDQPLSRVDLALDVLTCLSIGAFVPQQLSIGGTDVQIGQLSIFEPNLIFSLVVALDKYVGGNTRGSRLAKVSAWLWF